MRVRGIPGFAVLVFVLLAAVPVSYAKPWWASPGHWADYEYVMVGDAGGHEFKVVIRYHVEVVNATEKTFTVKTSITGVHIETDVESLKEQLSRQFSRLRGASKISTLPFKTRPEMLTTAPFYVSPDILPPDGRYRRSLETAVGRITIEAVYDKSTGWLKEAHVVYPKGHGAGVLSVREGVVRLVASNFIGNTPGYGSAGQGALLAAAAGVAAIGVVAALILLKKKRG